MEKLDPEIEIRIYEFLKIEILTPNEYVDTCEGYDDVVSRDDWDEVEYLSVDHPSYTRVIRQYDGHVPSSKRS
jgi:hypothetical protein